MVRSTTIIPRFVGCGPPVGLPSWVFPLGLLVPWGSRWGAALPAGFRFWAFCLLCGRCWLSGSGLGCVRVLGCLFGAAASGACVALGPLASSRPLWPWALGASLSSGPPCCFLRPLPRPTPAAQARLGHSNTQRHTDPHDSSNQDVWLHRKAGLPRVKLHGPVSRDVRSGLRVQPDSFLPPTDRFPLSRRHRARRLHRGNDARQLQELESHARNKLQLAT